MISKQTNIVAINNLLKDDMKKNIVAINNLLKDDIKKIL
jgi:hypothetical protein